MNTKESGWRRGWIVFVVLAVLTAVEFGISLSLANPLPWMTIAAIERRVGGALVTYQRQPIGR